MQVDPQIDQARIAAHKLGMGLVSAGIVLLISFWSAYYIGFVLAVGSILTGIIQINHTRTVELMMTNTQMGPPHTIFNTLRMANLIGAIGGIVGAILALVAFIVYIGWPIVLVAWVFFAAVGGIACLSISILAFLSYQKCVILHPYMAATAGNYVAQGGTTVVVGAPQQNYGQQGNYGQPQYQQQQGNYGQPQGGYQQQQSYGAPPQKSASPTPGL